MGHYKDSEQILAKLRSAKHTAIKSDLLDMQMERIRLRTELQMLEQAIGKVTEKYAHEAGIERPQSQASQASMRPNLQDGVSKGATLRSRTKSVS